LAEEGIVAEIPEEGATFQENAAAKAEGYASISGLLTLADDSGLEVEALGGEPGVRSARYAGEDSSDQERNDKLLANLVNVPLERRAARFRCVIALAEPGQRARLVEGTIEGSIAHRPKGSNGFGYDPVFFLPERERTMAELPIEEKNEISHRARAVREARVLLSDWQNSAD
jgi:XTP/dITP diphosphohydrolase